MISTVSNNTTATDFGNVTEPDAPQFRPVQATIKKEAATKPEKKGSWLDTFLKPVISFIYGLYDFLSGILKMFGVFSGKTGQ